VLPPEVLPELLPELLPVEDPPELVPEGGLKVIVWDRRTPRAETVMVAFPGVEEVRVALVTPPRVVAEKEGVPPASTNPPRVVSKVTGVPSGAGFPSAVLTWAVIVTGEDPSAIPDVEEGVRRIVGAGGSSPPVGGEDSFLEPQAVVWTRNENIRNTENASARFIETPFPAGSPMEAYLHHDNGNTTPCQ
jgi:hypothetical protein